MKAAKRTVWPKCPSCEKDLSSHVGESDNLRQMICKTDGCPDQGRVFGEERFPRARWVETESLEPPREADSERLATELLQTTDTDSQPIERFGRSPTSSGMFGKNLGPGASRRVMHQIVQTNLFSRILLGRKDPMLRLARAQNLKCRERKDCGAVEVNWAGSFRMDTRQGRIANKREHSRLVQLAQPTEDPNIHCVLELLSEHNSRHMHLSTEKWAMLAESIRPIVSVKTIGRQPKRMIRTILDMTLEYMGLATMEPPHMPPSIEERIKEVA